jgi:hypothetical protein
VLFSKILKELIIGTRRTRSRISHLHRFSAALTVNIIFG